MHPSRSLSHVRAALYSEPWMISDCGLEKICAVVESHAAGVLPESALAFDKQKADKNPLLEMVGNNAVVSIIGPVFPRANMLTAMSGATSSQAIASALDAAVENKPENIVLRIDSPGGAVMGGFELADKIHSVRESGVPVLALVEGMAASLGYLFASQADAIFLSRASAVGSVSVIFRAQNDERMQRNAGIDSLTLRSGDKKQVETILASGNSTTAQMAGVVRRIEKLHGMFVAAVKRGRPGMDESTFATGEMWTGQDAIDAGLADEIRTFEQLISEL